LLRVAVVTGLAAVDELVAAVRAVRTADGSVGHRLARRVAGLAQLGLDDLVPAFRRDAAGHDGRAEAGIDLVAELVLALEAALLAGAGVDRAGIVIVAGAAVAHAVGVHAPYVDRAEVRALALVVAVAARLVDRRVDAARFPHTAVDGAVRVVVAVLVPTGLT